MPRFLRTVIVLFLIFPFLFLAFQFGRVHSPDWAEIAWAAKNSFVQAFFSATISMLFGLWGAAGLLCFSEGLRRRWRSLMELLLLAPNFLPAIFTLLALLNLIDPFPMGRWGIVLVHVAINWGLAAVLVAGLVESKIGGVAELAWVEGCTRGRFLFRVLLPMLAKDLSLLWVFIFSVCFSSFAVPLVVGGGRGTTLEVLIYERIRLSTDWSQAVTIATLQSILLFGLALVAARGSAVIKERPARLHLFNAPSGLIPILGATFFWGLGVLQGLPSGLGQIESFFDLSHDLWSALGGTLLVGLGVGLLALAFLIAAASLVPSRIFEKFLSGYSPPSQALTAFAFLMIFPNEGGWPYFKIPVALFLLTAPVLWRMGWQAELDSLRRQGEAASTLGASRPLFLRWIVIPQLMPRASTLAGLAAVWATGDFAVSRILGHRDLTLAMMTETLMTGYRLSLATLLSFVLLLTGVVCFFLMKGIGRVLGRKPLS